MSINDFDWICDSCGVRGHGKPPEKCPECETKRYLLCKESG